MGFQVLISFVGLLVIVPQPSPVPGSTREVMPGERVRTG